MAWSDIGWETGIKTNDMAQAMSEIHIAVNEREEALDLTQTFINVGPHIGGTQTKAQPADLAGMPLHGGDGEELWFDNLVTLQDAIKALGELSLVDEDGEDLLSFTTTSGGDTLVVHATIISGIGIGDFESDPSTMDNDVWQRMKEYLDELLYAFVNVQKLPPVAISDSRSLNASTNDTDFEQLWDDMLAEASAPAALRIAILLRGDCVALAGGNFFYSCGVDSGLETTWDTEKYGAVVVSGSTPLEFIEVNTPGGALDHTLGYTYDGNASTVSSGSAQFVTGSHVWDNSLDEGITLFWKTSGPNSIPVDWPWSTAENPSCVHRAELEVIQGKALGPPGKLQGSVPVPWMTLDLTTILADQ